MSSYILKIVGVVFISIIIDLVLPNGKMEKYIKGAMALIIVFVIVSPLPGAIKTLDSFSLKTNENLIDYDFIKNTNKKTILNKEEFLRKELEQNGIKNAEIELITDLSKNNIIYLFANVNIENAVLKTSYNSININEKIIEIIMQNINIKKENILIYGQ